MAIEVFNRYEVKYLLNKTQYENILSAVPEYMTSDKYNKNNTFYSISNLYLDSNEDYFIRRSIEKPVYKEKLRLRAYGTPALDDIVYLEIKKKFKGLVNKRRTPFILQEAYNFLNNGTIPSESKLNGQVFREIEYVMKLFNSYPKVYISYDRLAFFAKDNNDFRMTIDTNIQTRRDDLRLENGMYGEQLLPPGTYLMEAKAAGAFPIWFCHLLSKNKIYSTSFSKYGEEYKKFYKEHKYA